MQNLSFHISLLLVLVLAVTLQAVMGFQCDVPEDGGSFLQTVNETAKAHMSVLQQQYEEFGPHLRLGIVSGFHPSEGSSSAYGLALKQMYAEYNGYSFKMLTGDMNNSTVENDSVSSYNPFRNYMALSALRSSLKFGCADCDYVVYMAADAAVLKFDLRLERIATKYKKFNVILVSGGTESFASTDFIMVRNNFWTSDFLEDWAKFYGSDNRRGVRDADLFEKFYKSDEMEMKENVKIISEGTLVSENPPIQRFKKANSILVMSNQANAMKRRLFQYAHVQLCNAAEEAEGGSVDIPFQLGISKSVLVDVSQQVYRELWNEKIEEYMLKSDTGENSFRATEELSFVSSHLVVALTQTKTPSAAEELSNIRSKTFKHMYLNMKRNSNKEATEDLIHTLKSVLRFGQDYVVHVKDQKEKKVAMKVIKELLEELMIHRKDDHDTQEALVNMNCDIGQMYADEGRFEDALAEFLAALRIARRLGNFIGERVILAPANHAADTLLLLKRYEEATVMYQAAIHLIRRFYGKEDLTTGYALVQSAIANYYFRKYKTCFKQIEEALEIMFEVDHGEEIDPTMHQHAMQMYDQCKGKKDEVVGDDGDNAEF